MFLYIPVSKCCMKKKNSEDIYVVSKEIKIEKTIPPYNVSFPF